MLARKTSMGFAILKFLVTARLTAAVFTGWAALKISGDIKFLRDQMAKRSLEETV